MFTREQVKSCEVIPLNNLFSVHQVSQCCGISRATILRLENKGLLKPAYIDEKTGYRWYDNNNITLIQQVKRFLEMGMSYDDALLYYNSNGTSLELLERVETRFRLFKRAYEEIKLRVGNAEQISFEFVTLPQCVCYCREFNGATIDDRYWALYNLYHEAVEKGYRLLASEPLFIVNKRTDFIEGKFEEKPVDFVCCIPLEPDFAPAEAVVYPGCRAFSCLRYGDYSHWGDDLNLFGEKIRELGLKPAGHMRAIYLVAPYTSLEFSKNSYVSRYVVPIEESGAADC